MDGNGRWAERRRRPRIIGHRAGARAVNLCIDYLPAARHRSADPVRVLQRKLGPSRRMKSAR